MIWFILFLLYWAVLSQVGLRTGWQPNRTFHLFGHQNLEFELVFFKDYWSWFEINCSWTRHINHAGFKFRVELFGGCFNLTHYDDRHWDPIDKKWGDVDEANDT